MYHAPTTHSNRLVVLVGRRFREIPRASDSKEALLLIPCSLTPAPPPPPAPSLSSSLRPISRLSEDHDISVCIN